MMLWACEKDEANPPVITEIRNYAASPDDTLITTLTTGQWVVISGSNLSEVSQVYFAGTPAFVNQALLTDGSVVIQVPDVPFASVPRDKLNEVSVVSSGGTASYEVQVTGPPIILYIRNYEASPNDTIINSIAPGQQINIIGYNLRNALKITFQDIDNDSLNDVVLSSIIYTDTSAIVTAHTDFSSAGLLRANKVSYTTSFGTGTYMNYDDPLWTFLAGGANKEKTWTVDFDKDGLSKEFPGPLWFSGDELRWNRDCATSGGNCWYWEPTWQGWMPPAADYGTMTFRLKGSPITPTVAVTQKATGKSGDFSGEFSLDVDAKTITFTEVIPLNMGWDNVDWSKAYIITLNKDGMQLGFKHKSKNELELYSYIPK